MDIFTIPVQYYLDEIPRKIPRQYSRNICERSQYIAGNLQTNPLKYQVLSIPKSRTPHLRVKKQWKTYLSTLPLRRWLFTNKHIIISEI